MQLKMNFGAPLLGLAKYIYQQFLIKKMSSLTEQFPWKNQSLKSNRTDLSTGIFS